MNGQFAPPEVNVCDAIAIELNQLQEFRDQLPNGYHKVITKKVKTMVLMRKPVVLGGKAIYDMEALFLRLLVVGELRHIDMKTVFQHELGPVPPALINEYGSICTGD